MPNTLKVLAVHGVGGNQRTADQWQPEWRSVIQNAIRVHEPSLPVDVEFVEIDDIFAGQNPDYRRAFRLLSTNWFRSRHLDMADPALRERGILDGLNDRLYWTAGMVVLWVEDQQIRARSRDRLREAIRTRDPHVVVAHSLGSLIAYDLAAAPDAGAEGAFRDRTLVTLGSQIGNPFVRGGYAGGRVAPIQDIHRWYHLYNPRDRVFASPIDLRHPRFQQIRTEFDEPGWFSMNHSAVNYFVNPAAQATVWLDVARRGAARQPAPSRTLSLAPKNLESRPIPQRPRVPRKALIVGINQYPDPRHRLEGCVNDAFLMSSVLQEMGFDPARIRLLLDQRATAAAILDHLEWLLDDVQPGDERVFAFSGHGVQIPAYDVEEEIDHLDEALAPVDFDWSRERLVVDDRIRDLYSQLPYGPDGQVHFAMVLDCCHSGGLARAGGRRVKAIDPPDDIRHRMLRWDARAQMWVPRELDAINSDFESARLAKASKAKRGKLAGMFGEAGVTHRLGRAAALRFLPAAELEKDAERLGHRGPYLPIIFQACAENQLAFEYDHGAIPHGAYSFALAAAFRDLKRAPAGRPVSFERIHRRAAYWIKQKLRYDQDPELVGPENVLRMDVPWMASRRASGSDGGAPTA